MDDFKGDWRLEFVLEGVLADKEGGPLGAAGTHASEASAADALWSPSFSIRASVALMMARDISIVCDWRLERNMSCGKGGGFLGLVGLSGPWALMGIPVGAVSGERLKVDSVLCGVELAATSPSSISGRVLAAPLARPDDCRDRYDGSSNCRPSSWLLQTNLMRVSTMRSA